MTRPVVLQVGPFPAWDQEPLDTAFDMRRLFEADDKVAYLADVGPAVRAIATRGGLGADRDLIASCPNCDLIAVYGVGYDAVDMTAANARGIKVTNTPDVLTGDVADLGVAMMLALGRRIGPAENWVRDGDWATKGAFPLTRRIFGRRAGILGMGRIGRAVAKRLSGFDMEIHYSDIAPIADRADWAFHADAVSLAVQSDILFVTLSASDATRHIVNKEVIEAVGPTGTIINISRASNVHEDALIEALETGALGAAGLDVFAGEPNVDARLLSLENVLLQPHHASGTVETRQDMGRLMRANIEAHFAGRPLLTPVN